MDSKFYYFKNSSAKEKEIKIPRSRSTLDQYTIIQTCSDFEAENDSECLSIPETIFKDNIPGFKQLRRNQWCIDAGFVLKLTKK